MLDALVDSMVAYLAQRFPDSVSIARYTGRFTERDLDRFAGRAPALLVSIQQLQLTGCNAMPAQALHGNETDETPRRRIEGTLTSAIAMLTKDKPGQGRDAVALELMETLAMALPHTTFDSAISRGVKAGSIRCQNLHTVSLDNKAVTLWGLTFAQDIRMETGEAPMFEPPAKVMLGLEPEIGPAHVEAYGEVVAEDMEDIKPGGTL